MGTVSDAATGLPLPGTLISGPAGVGVAGSSGDPRGPDAHFALFAPAGTSIYTATMQGYASRSLPATVPLSGAVRLDFALREPSSAPSQMTVASVPNPSLPGQAVAFTATVTGAEGTPTGVVTFTIDGAAVASPALVGNTASYVTASLAEGTHTVSASYGGDGTYAGSSASLAGGQIVSSVTISGTVNLQGREVQPPADAYSVALRVQLFAGVSAAPTYSTTVQTDRYGHFAVSGIATGTYTITVKHSHTLARTIQNVTLVAGANAVEIGLLREGDADDNNQVNITDFSILAAGYGKSPGRPGFDPRADFNESGRVNILDFSLLATNYGMSGDP